MELIKNIDEENVKTRSVFNKENNLVFDPPVYEQRYMKCLKILKSFDKKIKKIVEFGCAELKLLTYLKNGLQHVTRIDLVDIDEELLERFKSRTEPLISEYLNKRQTRLTANVWKGSVSVPNANFKDVDAVVAIELIEHVFPDVLEEIPYHIFGIIKPKLSIITTPNGEFNVLFNMKPGTFRHFDHKFEWTRAEFEDWCNHIVDRFPDYCVQFHGVGKAPEGHDHLGCVSQLGLFIRKDFLESSKDETEATNCELDEPDESIDSTDYKLIHTVTYPFFHDTRDNKEKLFDECSYHINRFRWIEDLYYNNDNNRIEIPIAHVVDACYDFPNVSIDQIRLTIKDKFQIENDFVIFPLYEAEDEEEEMNEEYQEEDGEEIATQKSCVEDMPGETWN